MKYIYGFEKFNESVEITAQEMNLYKEFIENITNIKLKYLTQDDILTASIPYFIKYTPKEDLKKL